MSSRFSPFKRLPGRPSYWIALTIAVTASLWVLSGQFGGPEPSAQTTGAQQQAASVAPSDRPAARVRVRTITARPYLNELILFGRTEASRYVTLKAETSGLITNIGAERGTRVQAGDVVASIDLRERKARLAETNALVTQRSVEFEAARKLAEKGYRSETKRAEAKALLDAARAAAEQMKIDIEHTAIRAPFDGVLNEREVELGDFVDIGDTVGTIVDLDPIVVVGQVSERDITKIEVGDPGAARLVTGEAVTGTVRYVSAVADPVTRTFAVELEVANPDLRVVEGLTCELRLPVDEVMAHVVPSSVLTLADDGALGLKLVDAENRVKFVPVRIIGDSHEGVWLAGLPDEVTLITVGQEFVDDGQRIEPVAESAEATGPSA